MDKQKKIINSIFSEAGITEYTEEDIDEKFSNIGIDSLMLVKIIVALSTEFDIDMYNIDVDWLKVNSIRQLAESLENEIHN